MSRIRIEQLGITKAGTECIVNAANEQLQAGGGVCGVIFQAAGYKQLQKACDDIGYCNTGSAVITPAYNLNAKYIIHADQYGMVAGIKNHRNCMAATKHH